MGKKACHGKVMENGQKNKVMEIQKGHGISSLLTANHPCEIPIIPYIYRPTAVFWLWQTFS